MAEILAFPSGKKITTTKTDPRLVNLELREDNANAVADNMIMGMIQDLEDTNHKINEIVVAYRLLEKKCITKRRTTSSST